MKPLNIALAILITSAAYCQSIAPSMSSNNVVAGRTNVITLNYTAGTNPVAALQWNITLPPGAVAVWSVASAGTTASKSVTCGPATQSPQVCILYGMNANVVASGAIASAVITFPTNLRGAQNINIFATLGASATGSGVTVTGGATSVTVQSPFDLNNDGKVDVLDLTLAINQVIGITACGTADFDNNGVCDVKDIMALVIDANSPNP